MGDLTRFGATLLIIITMATCTCGIVAEMRTERAESEQSEQQETAAEYWAEWNSLAPVAAHATDCHCDTCCLQSENPFKIINY